jgi:hypothetical protein
MLFAAVHESAISQGTSYKHSLSGGRTGEDRLCGDRLLNVAIAGIKFSLIFRAVQSRSLTMGLIIDRSRFSPRLWRRSNNKIMEETLRLVIAPATAFEVAE